MKWFKKKESELNRELIEFISGGIFEFVDDIDKLTTLPSHDFRGKTYTTEELIAELIDMLDILLEDNKPNNQTNAAKNKVFDILKVIYWDLR